MPAWQPSASLAQLRSRSALLSQVRQFFAQREVLEVETPLLCSFGVTDPSLEPLKVQQGASLSGGERYLQTSPEYAMKRLLAQYPEPIFQISRAFRDGEAGARHNPEFSLLEWYRPGWNHHQLMEEVAQLCMACLGEKPVSRYTYRELFLFFLNVDPFVETDAALRALAGEHIDIGSMEGERDLWLDLLLSHLIEPQLRASGLCFVYDYPASQAALARVDTTGEYDVGHRFELYVDGVELANGYWELADAREQRVRFEADNARRRNVGQPERPIDPYFMEALEAGFPDCSGVALGVDRLLMLQTGCEDIRDVLAFDWKRS
ncbi:MAG: EF-P lysine aminoacylase EpmA [Halioglobus sp.]